MTKPTQHLANHTLACHSAYERSFLRPCRVTVSHRAAVKGHGTPGSTRKRQETELGRRGCQDQVQVQTYHVPKAPGPGAAQSWLPLSKTATRMLSSTWVSILTDTDARPSLMVGAGVTRASACPACRRHDLHHTTPPGWCSILLTHWPIRTDANVEDPNGCICEYPLHVTGMPGCGQRTSHS